MSALNKDILFDIAKKVVQNGDQDKVYHFGLSGKQCFFTLKNVFSSVTYLELYEDHYVVGWNKGCCTFDFNCDKPHSRTVMECLGNSILELSINCSIGAFYSSILDKIIQAKKLTSLVINNKAGFQYFWKLIKACPGTLKKLSAPTRFMRKGKSATKHLNLDLLTYFGKFCSQQLFHCCKTTKLILNDSYMLDALYMFKKTVKKNQNLSVITAVTFNITTLQGHLSCYDPNAVMQLFPSLQHLTFNTAFLKCDFTIENDMEGDSLLEILEFCVDNTHFIFENFCLPQKLTYIYEKENRPNVVDIISLNHNYEYDNSEPDFYCYLQTIEWAEKEIFFEVKIAK